jgi:CubicO group peptidase (beta-lactamase class C family)
MKRLFKGTGYLLLALLVVQTVFYWQDPVYWRRYYVSFIQMGNVDMEFFKPYVVIGNDNAAPLKTASAEEKTLSPEAIDDLVAYAKDFNSFALIVIHQGKVQLEWYNDKHRRDSLTQSQSMHKTLQAALIGAAIEDGFIQSIDEPIGQYLTEWRDDDRGQITIRNLLTMSSGLEQYGFSLSPFSKAFSWLYSSNRAPIVFATQQLSKPGQQFEYNDINAQLLGIIVTRATNKPYAQYLDETLWQPLDAATTRVWMDHEDGMAMSACCLISPAMNWARVGLLIKDNGAYNGQQLLAADWVKAMTSPNGLTPHYGYQTWLANNAIPNPRPGGGGYLRSEPFLAEDIIMLSGYGAQRVYISREKDLVIVRMGLSAGPKPLKDGWDNAYLVNTAIRGMHKETVESIETSKTEAGS